MDCSWVRRSGCSDLEVHGEQVKLLAEITLTRGDRGRVADLVWRATPRVRGAAAPAGDRPTAHDPYGGPGRSDRGAGVSFAEALVLVIVLACADAALGQAVVSGERVPLRIRQGLNVASGLNGRLACRCSSSRPRSPSATLAPPPRAPPPSSCSSRSATASSPERSARSRCESPRATSSQRPNRRSPTPRHGT